MYFDLLLLSTLVDCCCSYSVSMTACWSDGLSGRFTVVGKQKQCVQQATPYSINQLLSVFCF